MNRSVRTFVSSSFFVWVVVAIGALAYLFTIQNGRLALRPDRVKFGIDLVGGTYITLSVDIDKAVELELHAKKQNLLNRLKEANHPLPVAQSIEKDAINFKFDSAHGLNAAYGHLPTIDHDLSFTAKELTLSASLKEAALNRLKRWAVHSNIEVLRSRIDKLGVGEISIAAQGEKNIIVELPNVDDPQKAKAMIGKAALLEIKLIERMEDDAEKILEDYDGELPDDMEIVSGKEDRGQRLYFLVPKYADITGRLLKDSYADIGGNLGTEWVVHFEFNPEGADKFYELTRNNYKRKLAIILDGSVISYPEISVPIREHGYIHSSSFTQETAKELAMLLKSGAFVAPVTFAQERQIGPSLGQESIYKGLFSCAVGMALLLIFSILFYKMAGFFAFITLVYNLLITLIMLSWLGATLTLPGIAGMVLTVGMAIDASILIYEKIREELARGTAVSKAVDEGFSDAMAVILDSNITTFLIGLVLYYFGTGPIQGFAITMMVGIIATLLTGLFFLRSIFSFIITFFHVRSLSI
ncbi:MAG: protein translocase subunit SecD [Candidatus Babeliales bacterium]